MQSSLAKQLYLSQNMENMQSFLAKQIVQIFTLL